MYVHVSMYVRMVINLDEQTSLSNKRIVILANQTHSLESLILLPR